VRDTAMVGVERKYTSIFGFEGFKALSASPSDRDEACVQD
jgi:hypothetical protein